MTRVGLAMTGTIAAVGLAGCGGTEDRGDAAVAPAETSASETAKSPPLSGDAILIQTRITDARAHTGEVLDGSVLGESAFCPGGTSTGSSVGPTITATFSCPGGTLEVQFAPRQNSAVQSAVWEVVGGTGDLEGLRGGGSMVAAFGSDDPDVGREIFTGTVSR